VLLASASAAVPSGVTAPPVTRDLAPNTLERDKWTVIIGFAGGRREEWLLPSDNLNVVRNQLPPGAAVLDLIPPSSLMGHSVPPPSVPPGTVGYASAVTAPHVVPVGTPTFVTVKAGILSHSTATIFLC